MQSKNIDYKLFFIVLGLIVFWMIMISSVSVYSSYRVTDLMVQKWQIEKAYNYFYVLRNIIHVIVSLVVMVFVVKINYQFFDRYSKRIFGVNILLLIIVLVIWVTLNWATGWIPIPWIPFTLQPSEFMKVWVIIFLAAFFKKYHWYLSDFKRWFLPFMWILASVVLLLALQPDFWTLMVIIPISVIMYFYAWMNVKHLLLITLLWMTLIFAVYSLWDYDKETGKNLNTLGYIRQRIDNFFDDNEDAIKNQTINHQTKQALIAIWSGGFRWKWFWGSIQKFGYLPEVQGDFVFSAVIEELWFLWWVVLLFVYMYIWYKSLYIANRVKDKFAKFTAVWIWVRILIQSFVNIWVNLNIIPLTWLTLPFISYGGSSLLSLMIWLWILLSISREVDDNNLARKDRNKIIFNT
jgi:cell division protein FtsW